MEIDEVLTFGRHQGSTIRDVWQGSNSCEKILAEDFFLSLLKDMFKDINFEKKENPFVNRITIEITNNLNFSQKQNLETYLNLMLNNATNWWHLSKEDYRIQSSISKEFLTKIQDYQYIYYLIEKGYHIENITVLNKQHVNIFRVKSTFNNLVLIDYHFVPQIISIPINHINLNNQNRR
jgi:hypothetical protein